MNDDGDGDDDDDDVPPIIWQPNVPDRSGHWVAHRLLSRQEERAIRQVAGRGRVGIAKEGADGRMHARIRILPDRFRFDPAVLVLPHGGDLDLEVLNDDNNTHGVVFPSNGDYKFLWLVNFSRGSARLNLDGPGQYWYGSRTGNDEGSGLNGAIVVLGEVPDEAKLDRPPQRRP